MAFPPGHFHSPLPSLAEIAEYRGIADRTPTELPGVDLGIERQIDLLRRLEPYIEHQPFGSEEPTSLRYHFLNGWFGGSDPIILYSLLRTFQPRRIIEVGSGWSTAAMLDTYEGRTLPDITLVEPNPERLFSLLREGDRERVTVLEQRLQDVPLETFEQLERNDVLFVDSTHVVKLGSDVNYLFFEILPRLAVGVLVQLHDIHFPFEYELAFVDKGYGWNETYLLRAFLAFNNAFEIVLWNDMLHRLCGDVLKAELPMLIERPAVGPDGSLWLRRIA